MARGRADPGSGIQRLVSYLVRSTPSGNVRVSTRFRFTQLSDEYVRWIPDYRPSRLRALLDRFRHVWWRDADQYRSRVKYRLSDLARVVKGGVLLRDGRSLTDLELEHVAAVVRRAAYLELRSAERSDDRDAGWSYGLGLVSASAG